MSKTCIYFMSGTGNSYRVATWIGELAREHGAESSVIPIESGHPEEEVAVGPESLLGIVMPTHGFTAPWHMLKFVVRLPRRRQTGAFCVATRAGVKLGPLFTPGLGGTATFLVALILWLKGFSVRGVTGIDMPSNWTAFHWGLHPKNANAIIARARIKTKRVAERLLTGRRWWLSVGNLYDLTLGLALTPASLGYLVVGRYFLAKLFFANNKCNACGLCVDNCPVGAVTMWGKQNPRPFWRHNCESCMRCMAYCPQRAIEAGQSWGILLYFACTPPSMFLAYKILLALFPSVDPDVHYLWIAAAAAFIAPFFIFLAYWVFAGLTRIPLVNSLFTYTTLTRIYRRYHEPDTKLKQLGVPPGRERPAERSRQPDE
ncbi:EFR1 family ferrodoxin [Planctomycetota bacterium]